MENELSRRNLIKAGVLVAAAGSAVFAAAGQQAVAGQQPAAKPPKRPKLPDDQVKDFVIAGHFDLDKVKQMLDTTPRLINASWDWTNGDFEMAIGGAGHVGRKDIAEYLISRGGRYDLFVAAMMDEIEIVTKILDAHPGLIQSLGPHGIPLLAHAENGKASRVLELLKKRSLA